MLAIRKSAVPSTGNSSRGRNAGQKDPRQNVELNTLSSIPLVVQLRSRFAQARKTCYQDGQYSNDNLQHHEDLKREPIGPLQQCRPAGRELTLFLLYLCFEFEVPAINRISDT